MTKKSPSKRKKSKGKVGSNKTKGRKQLVYKLDVSSLSITERFALHYSISKAIGYAVDGFSFCEDIDVEESGL